MRETRFIDKLLNIDYTGTDLSRFPHKYEGFVLKIWITIKKFT